ncbi:MAG: hypothetical protein RL413_1522 [Actinomycetota bacterium]
MKRFVARSILLAVALLSPVHLHGAHASNPSEPSPLRLAEDSQSDAGLFHLVGPEVPPGADHVRYRNVDKAIQVGLVPHESGPLDLWLRAPAPLGSTITLAVDAMAGEDTLVKSLGSITLFSGDRLLPLPVDSGTGRRMVIDITAQQVWLVESSGRVSSTFLMSGRRRPTESGFELRGRFRVYSKSERLWTSEGASGRFMVRYQRTVSSVGTHGIPSVRGQLVQSIDDLGWPLSDGCARLAFNDAKRLYAWAGIGTTVVVVGR